MKIVSYIAFCVYFLRSNNNQSRVCVPDVYFEVGRGSELEAAAIAGVRLLLSVVHPAVSDQLTLLSETLVALGATKWLLACDKHQRKRADN